MQVDACCLEIRLTHVANRIVFLFCSVKGKLRDLCVLLQVVLEKISSEQ
jgi:hypothetical protein